MVYVQEGPQQAQAGEDKTKVIASRKKAREVLIADWRLEAYRQARPSPCPEFEELEQG